MRVEFPRSESLIDDGPKAGAATCSAIALQPLPLPSAYTATSTERSLGTVTGVDSAVGAANSSGHNLPADNRHALVAAPPSSGFRVSF